MAYLRAGLVNRRKDQQIPSIHTKSKNKNCTSHTEENENDSQVHYLPKIDNLKNESVIIKLDRQEAIKMAKDNSDSTKNDIRFKGPAGKILNVKRIINMSLDNRYSHLVQLECDHIVYSGSIYQGYCNNCK
jgi:hypothetical protein